MPVHTDSNLIQNSNHVCQSLSADHHSVESTTHGHGEWSILHKDSLPTSSWTHRCRMTPLVPTHPTTGRNLKPVDDGNSQNAAEKRRPCFSVRFLAVVLVLLPDRDFRLNSPLSFPLLFYFFSKIANRPIGRSFERHSSLAKFISDKF